VSRRTLLGGTALGLSAVVLSPGSVTASGVPRLGFTVSPSGIGTRSFDADVSRITALAGGWVRFAVLPVDVVHDWNVGASIVWDAGALDEYGGALDAATAAGLKICLLTVTGVTGVPDRTYLDVMESYWRVLARRFGDRVDVWQVFNEADGTDFKDHTELPHGVDPAYLDRLNTALSSARRAIHSESPGVALTTNAGGFPVDDATESRWHTYFGGISDSLDLLTVDVYPELSPEAIASLPRRLRTLKDAFDKPVAVGEFGLPTGPGRFSEAQQSTSLCDTLHALVGSVAEHLIIYQLRDEGHGSPTDGFGIFDATGSPKSAVADLHDAISRYDPKG
jgi:hypothetical protein